MINGDWKYCYGLENSCNLLYIYLRGSNKFLFETLFTHLILYGYKVWGCGIFRESSRKIEKMKII